MFTKSASLKKKINNVLNANAKVLSNSLIPTLVEVSTVEVNLGLEVSVVCAPWTTRRRRTSFGASAGR